MLTNFFKLCSTTVSVLILTGLIGCENVQRHDNSFRLPEYATIKQINTALKDHNITCHELAQFYLSRIYTYNLTLYNNQPPLNAISQLNPEVLDQAAALDHEYTTTHKIPGSLFCVPVIIKDNIDVLGMETTSGSYALLGTTPLGSALLVKKLRDAGALIIAKGGMDELAMGASGISSLDGRIGNAYDSSQNPGGSSSGSAVAIAAGFGVIGIGTDNSGSVRIPAAFNGIYGLRPSMGLIDKNGIFPMGNMDGTPGPLARNITDLAMSLNVLADNGLDYTRYLKADALYGKTIAVAGRVGNYNVWDGMPANVRAFYDNVIKNLAKSGVKIIQLDLPEFNNDRKNNMAGTVEDVNAYLEYNLATRNNIEDICNSGRTRVMGGGASCLKLIDNIPQRGSSGYKKAQAIISYNKLYLMDTMKRQHIDGILMPLSKSGSSTYDLSQVNSWRAPLSSNSGLPSLTVPVGYISNMPVGLEMVGNFMAESNLLSMAYAYEQRYGVFVPPHLYPSDKYNNLTINQLNNLYHQIGKVSYEQFIKTQQKNEVTPEQSYQAVSRVVNNLKFK